MIFWFYEKLVQYLFALSNKSQLYLKNLIKQTTGFLHSVTKQIDQML